MVAREKLKKRGLGMFKKIASVVALLLVFLCGAQGMHASAESVGETFSDGKYVFSSKGEVSNRTFEISGEKEGSFITVKSEVVFKNVVVTGKGAREKVIQTASNGKLTLDGVTIKSGARSAKINENSKVRTIYANKEIYIKDLTIEDGVSEAYDIENGSSPLTIEKANVKSILLGGGVIVVNQNSELENVIEISLKPDSALRAVGKTIVQGDKDFPASNIRNKFKLEKSLTGEGKFSLDARGNDLILVNYNPSLDIVEGEDAETSEGEAEGGTQGGNGQEENDGGSSPSVSESGDNGENVGGDDNGEDANNGKEENGGNGEDESQGGENPSEGDEPKEPIEVDAIVDVGNLVYDGTNQFEKVQAKYVLDDEEYLLGVRLLEDDEMVNAKEYTLELYILESDSNFGEVELVSNKCKIAIKKRDISVSLEKEKFVYSDSPVELKPIVENEVSKGDASVTLSSEGEVNAGTYNVDVCVGSPNYKLVSNATLKYTIDKKYIDVGNISIENISKVYDGQACIEEPYFTANGFVLVEYHISQEYVNVGEYDINLVCTLTEKAKRNYTLPDDLDLTAKLEITPRVIVPTLEKSSFVYNEQTPNFNVKLENVASGDKPQVQLIYPRDKVDVGEYELTIRLEDDEKDYTFETETVTLLYSITKAEIDTKDIEIRDITETYNGEIIECKPYTTANGLVNVLYGNVTYKNVGTYYLTLTCTLTETAKRNYTLPKNLDLTATLIVSPREITPKLEKSTFVYNGEVPNLKVNLENVVEGDNPKVKTLSTKAYVDTGDYKLKVSLEDSEKNYTFKTTVVELLYSITKAELDEKDIEIKPLDKVFDGKAIVATPYLTAGGLVEVSYVENEYINAGTYAVGLSCALTGAGAKNYTLPSDLSLSTSLIITPCLVTPKLKKTTFEYDGKTPVLEVVFDGKIDGFEPSVKIDDSGEKSVDKHTIFVSLLDDEKNYVFESAIVSLSYNITPKVLEASLVGKEYIYTGSKPNIEVALSGICEKDIVNCVVVADNIHAVGTHYCTLSLCGEDAKEYVLSTSSLTKEYIISKAQIDMSGVVFEDDEIEYTGSKYEPQISGVPSGVKVTFRANTDSYSVGDYVIVANFEPFDPVNYSLSLDTLSINLHITPKVVDLSGVSFEDVYEVYSGDEYTITPTNVPTLGVKMEALGNTKFVDAGDYNITYSFTNVNGNYTLFGKSVLTAILHIQKADIDMSGVTFEDDEYVYDGTPHTLALAGTLPSEVIALPLCTYINFGEYTITQNFEVTNTNYNTPSPISAKLTITKRPLTATLTNAEFTYNGEEFETALNLDGVLEGDTVRPNISGNKNTLAGVYKVAVLGLDNPNYSLSQTEYAYEIHKASVDMSGVLLQDKEITYDAKEYIPSLEGDLPSVVTGNLVYPKIKDVGKYTVLASFSTDANHICPSPLTATITVSPKPVVVHFNNYSNLLYTGEVQEISCTISGMLDEEDFSIIYSNEPREVGEYTAQVVLQTNSNYIIWNSSICTFNIYANTKTTSSDEYTLTLEGGLFSATETAKLKTVTLSDAVQNSLASIHKDLSNVESFKISLDGNYDELETYLKLSSLKASSSKTLTLYTLSNDGTLQKLDYTLSDGTLSFKATPNTTIILVEETIQTSFPNLLIALVTLSVLTFSIALPLTIRHKKKRARR